MDPNVPYMVFFFCVCVLVLGLGIILSEHDSGEVIVGSVLVIAIGATGILWSVLTLVHSALCVAA
jgi:hypothetical protein